MLHIPLLVCLAGAPDLGSWDFEPWEHLAPSGNPTASPLVSSHRIRGIFFGTDAAGAPLDSATLDYWTDERGICQSRRTMRFDDTSTLETWELYGLHPGKSDDIIPPDSARSTRWVAGQLRETGVLRREDAGTLTRWIYKVVPPPRDFRMDWDSAIVQRDAIGRFTSRRNVWTDFAWESDSVAWGPDGNPSRWITSSGGGWTEKTELHVPTWRKGRLVRDEILLLEPTDFNGTDSLTRIITCDWIDDTLLRGCTSVRHASDASTVYSLRLFDSLVVVRDETARARRREMFSGGKTVDLILWDAQGRKVSNRDLSGTTYPSLAFDSSTYAALPWPVHLEYRYGSATTAFELPPVQDHTTIDWQLDPVELAVSPRARPASIAVTRVGTRLRAEAPAGTSGTFRLLDPAGRERSRAPLRDGRAALDAPGQGGVWIWRLEDRDGREIGRGGIAIP